jgi:molybdenum-dependent DNA-binding transcriptional regulator ModE
MSDFTSPRSFLRQIDLSSLDLFVLICEHGSIARAAEQGGMVASAVSKRVAELESLARTPLLLRHARGCARPCRRVAAGACAHDSSGCRTPA